MTVSAFFAAERGRLSELAQPGPVIDLASGRGRHALACAEAGLRTVALDRNPAHLRELAAERDVRRNSQWGTLDSVLCDLEAAPHIPLKSGSCSAVLVFRFLYRPLMPAIVELLAPGGLLIYETFTVEQRSLGFGPRREDFLLEHAELPRLVGGLEVLSYDEGLSNDARPCHTARLVARRS